MRKRSVTGTDWAGLLVATGLGLTLAMQLTTMRASDLTSVYAVMATVSRFAALSGTYCAIVGIFLMARIPWVERGVGHNRLAGWHRNLGPWSLYLIGAHVLLIVVSFAGLSKVSISKQLQNFLTFYEWMWFALAGFVLLVIAGITSYKKARAKLSYEAWWLIHLFSYSAIAAAFMHQVLNGQVFVGHTLNRAYWTGLYLAMAGSIIYWRIGVPLIRSLKVNLKVEQVVVEAPGVVSVLMKGHNLDSLQAKGGQFFHWRFLSKGHFLMSHPFSLSALPTKTHLRITVKDSGDHTKLMSHLPPGTRVFIEGPFGAFTARRASQPHVVLIAGGVGITPLRVLLEELSGGVQLDLIFRAAKQEDLLLKAELDQLEGVSGGSIRVHYLVGPRRDHPMDAAALQALVPQIADSDIYMCGPASLLDEVGKAAAEIGVPKSRLHDERFAFHKMFN